MTGPELATTRRSWHAVAELVLAGPQHRRTGTIRLRVVPGGFATTRAPDLRVVGTEVVGAESRIAIRDRTCAELGEVLGVDPGAPADLYRDGSGVGVDEALSVDAEAAEVLAEALGTGAAALTRLAPDEIPVLWPEHFDVATTLGEVNYGVSLGDTHIGEPYAYVGPWRQRSGPYWNAPFGAARPLSELAEVEAVLDFLTEGRRRAAEDPVA